MRFFHKVGLVCVRDGRVLLCRKRQGSGLLILPGGCIEPGESHMDCLNRELREELGDDVSVLDPEFLWTCEAPGADGGRVRIELYRGELTGTMRASGEIETLVWFGNDGNPQALAPSLRRDVLPELVRRNLL